MMNKLLFKERWSEDKLSVKMTEEQYNNIEDFNPYIVDDIVTPQEIKILSVLSSVALVMLVVIKKLALGDPRFDVAYSFLFLAVMATLSLFLMVLLSIPLGLYTNDYEQYRKEEMMAGRYHNRKSATEHPEIVFAKVALFTTGIISVIKLVSMIVELK